MQKTIYVEVPVEVEFEYPPGEKPDYSEASPCPRVEEGFDLLNVKPPHIPTEPTAVDAWLNKHAPNWEDEIWREIQARKQAGEAAKEDARREYEYEYE